MIIIVTINKQEIPAFAGMEIKMTYYTFLKGVNVGGNHIIKMAELKTMFEAMGFQNVRTFIQSGNVVYDSPAKADSVNKEIEASLTKELGYKVHSVTRSRNEMEKIIKEYPFTKIKGHEDCKISVGFLCSAPAKPAIKELEAFNTDSEIFAVSGNNLYHLFRGNYSDSIFFKKNLAEKILKITCTVRNWNTVNKIMKI
jgi:uncharacterized protein (DUF1697 family)